MTPLDEDVERVARSFHFVYERFAPAYGYRTRESSAVPWEDVPDDNKNLMRATVSALLDSGVIKTGIAVLSLADQSEEERMQHEETTGVAPVSHPDTITAEGEADDTPTTDTPPESAPDAQPESAPEAQPEAPAEDSPAPESEPEAPDEGDAAPEE